MQMIWVLAGLSVLLLATLVFMLTIYFRAKHDADNPGKEKKALETGKEVSACLAELQQQKKIVEQLIIDCDPEDKKRLMLFECWVLFLDVEYSIISTHTIDADIDTALEKFVPLTDDVDFAQSMDMLVKQIAAQKKLASNMTKEIEAKSKILERKTEATDQLNAKLEKLRAELEDEDELDADLLSLRLQLSELWRLENHVKEQLSAAKRADQPQSDYQELLESFVEDSEIEDFLAPVQAEYQSKLEQLKTMADYQKGVIQELKNAIKGSNDGDSTSLSLSYDVALARLEKTFADKKTILHKLEAKLDSLQEIKQSLTLDFQTQNALVTAKEIELQSKAQAEKGQETNAMQNILAQQQTSVQAMEDLVDQAPLIKESEQLITQQTSKIETIKQMMNESELLVEVLEQDLDKEQKRQDELQSKLADLSELLVNSANSNTISDHEMNALIEENKALADEIKTMEKELLSYSAVPTDEVTHLKEQIEALDEKIIKVKTEYDQMEEKYLSALL